jgi:hypothetical protein
VVILIFSTHLVDECDGDSEWCEFYCSNGTLLYVNTVMVHLHSVGVRTLFKLLNPSSCGHSVTYNYNDFTFRKYSIVHSPRYCNLKGLARM